MYLFIYLFVYLCIYLFIYLFMYFILIYVFIRICVSLFNYSSKLYLYIQYLLIGDGNTRDLNNKAVKVPKANWNKMRLR